MYEKALAPLRKNAGNRINRSTRVGLLVLLVILSPIFLNKSSGQGKPQKFDCVYSATDNYCLNTGFAAASFTLAYFDQKVDAAQLQLTLRMGDYLQEPIPLQALATEFNKASLHTRIVETSLRAALTALNATTLAIVQRASALESHYAVLFRTRGRIGFFDYPASIQSADAGEVLTALGGDVRGTVLFVDTKELPDIPGIEKYTLDSSTTLALAVSPTETYEGDLIVAPKLVAITSYSESASDIIAEASLSNRGNIDLMIEDVKGPCRCFKSFEGPRRIPPNKTVQVVFRFSASEFDRASGTTVSVRSNDSKLPVCAIRFAVATPASRASPVLTLGRNVSLGKISADEVTRTPVYLFIIIDPSYVPTLEIDRIEFDHDAMDVKTSATQFSVQGRQFKGYRLDVTLTARQQTRFNDRITVQTNHRIDREIGFGVNGHVVSKLPE